MPSSAFTHPGEPGITESQGPPSHLLFSTFSGDTEDLLLDQDDRGRMICRAVGTPRQAVSRNPGDGKEVEDWPGRQIVRRHSVAATPGKSSETSRGLRLVHPQEEQRPVDRPSSMDESEPPSAMTFSTQSTSRP